MALRVGLVGSGRMATTHCQALLKCGVDIPVVVTPSSGGLPSLIPGARTCRTLDEALGFAGHLDGLVIASSTNSQASYVLEATRAGIQAIFVEKPLAMTSDEALCARNSVHAVSKPPFVQLGFHRRHDYCFRALRSQLNRSRTTESADLKSVHLISYDANPPSVQARQQGYGHNKFAQEAGSLFVDFSTHDYDQLRWLTGDEFEVCTVMHQRNIITEEEDAMIVLRGIQSGCRAVIENSRNCGYGHDQRAHILLGNGKLLHTVGDELNVKSKVYPDFLARYANAYDAQMAHFVKQIEKKQRNGVAEEGDEDAAGLDDVLESLRLAEACQRIVSNVRPSAREVSVLSNGIPAQKHCFS